MTDQATKWTPREHTMCKAGYVYIKDMKQARNGSRAVAKSLSPYEPEDLIFDHPAFDAETWPSGAKIKPR
jgi:hypothetical protein